MITFKPLRIFLIAMLFVLGVWVMGYAFFAYKIINLAPPENQATADAIIVVTGGSKRINKGLDLLQDGHTNNLFISGVNKKVTLATLLSMWDGYDKDNRPCCIALGYSAENTWENAQETRLWIKSQENIKTIWLITSNYHMPRAWVELRHALPDLKIIAYPVESDVTVNEQGGFLRVSMREYSKTILTYLRLKFLRFAS
jgi:uncharacterized SAM-binding protein YcdF (DUF218 family)